MMIAALNACAFPYHWKSVTRAVLNETATNGRKLKFPLKQSLDFTRNVNAHP